MYSTIVLIKRYYLTTGLALNRNGIKNISLEIIPTPSIDDVIEIEVAKEDVMRDVGATCQFYKKLKQYISK